MYCLLSEVFMKIKLLISVLILAVVLLIIFNNDQQNSTRNDQDEPITSTALNTRKENIDVPSNEANNDSEIVTLTSQQKTSVSEQEVRIQEISDRIFSDDAYVEIFSLEMLMGFCEDANMLEEFITSSQSYISTQQQETIANYKEQCQHYQTQYPNLTRMNRKERLAGIKPQSHLGILLERRKNISSLTRQERDELEAETLIEAIREQNSSVAIEISFSHRFDQSIALQLTDLLNSKDMTYIGQISQLAVVNMACEYQGGIACESGGALMMLVCSQQPDSCGLDFPTWYQQNTLPGMKNDVDTLVSYYLRTAE
jgi:uncharacterized protein (UPF0333 family)